jgi:heme/copper-type cytochrome/quinol oxidase subunit 2
VQKFGLLIVIATFALAAGVLYTVSLHPFSPSQGASTVEGVQCSSYSSSFTVVASESGYNDSTGHGAPGKHWPILCARLGEQVTINFVNADYAEPHGFAIAGYDEAGITVLPGHSAKITIYASAAGDFKIYCNVVCAVHSFMQSGILVIS